MRDGQSSDDDTIEARDGLADLVEQFFTSRRTPPAVRDTELTARGERFPLSSGLAATSWGAGPTVLLAHGWNSRGSHWISFIEALNAAGFRAVAVDAPAHGDSPGTQTNAFHYGMELFGVGRELGRDERLRQIAAATCRIQVRTGS